MRYTVKQARMFAGLTQQYMADRLNIHKSTYLKLERNPDRITIGQAKVISQETGIGIDEIFFAS